MTEIAIATEDEPSEQVAAKLVVEVGATVSLRLRKGGYGYLKSKLKNFAQMARHQPVLMLVDLDQHQCPRQFKEDWFCGVEMPRNLFFRIVIREIESWLLADKVGLSEFLGVSESNFPERPDELPDPKAVLLKIAAKSSREIRSDMVVHRGAISSQGIGYNARLIEFIRSRWNVRDASGSSPSLSRALDRLSAAGIKCDCCDNE